MEKITKRISCDITMNINQEISLTKSEWEKLEKFLEKHYDIEQYEKTPDGGLKTCDMYDLLYSQIDLESGKFLFFEDVEIEDSAKPWDG